MYFCAFSEGAGKLGYWWELRAFGVLTTFKTVEFPSNITSAVCGITVGVKTRGEARENMSVSGFVALLPVGLYLVKWCSELKMKLFLPVAFRGINFLSLPVCLHVGEEQSVLCTEGTWPCLEHLGNDSCSIQYALVQFISPPQLLVSRLS
jgi:hypothetical protein